MGDWIIEANEDLSKMTTALLEYVIDTDTHDWEPLVSVLSVLDGQCCEGDYIVLKGVYPMMAMRNEPKDRLLIVPIIMDVLKEHKWENFPYANAALLVYRLLEQGLLKLRWIEWG